MLFTYNRFDNQPMVETVGYGADKYSLRLKLMEMDRRIFSWMALAILIDGIAPDSCSEYEMI